MRWLIVVCWMTFCGIARAQVPVEITSFDIDRSIDGVSLSAQLQFELSPTVEEALIKGIPMVFVAETELFRERWYWYDKSIASSARYFRLAFQPLTRRWRLNMNAGGNNATAQGLAFNQSFDDLPQAMAAIKRISGWRVASANDLDPSVRYRFDFRFRLDVGQLPRPFQIGAIGQSDWDIAITRSVVIPPEPVK